MLVFGKRHKVARNVQENLSQVRGQYFMKLALVLRTFIKKNNYKTKNKKLLLHKGAAKDSSRYKLIFLVFF